MHIHVYPRMGSEFSGNVTILFLVSSPIGSDQKENPIRVSHQTKASSQKAISCSSMLPLKLIGYSHYGNTPLVLSCLLQGAQTIAGHGFSSLHLDGTDWSL